MGLTRDYATTMYNWLKKFAPVLREPISEDMYNEQNPKPTEYISYSADTGNFAQQFIQAITINSQSTAWNYVMDIVDAIEKEIGEGGLILRQEWGYIKIEKGNPFYQDKPDEDSSIRAGYVNLLITIYQKDV